MRKKRILIWVGAVLLIAGLVAVLVIKECIVPNDRNIENEDSSPRISRIEGHLYSPDEKDVVIEQTDEISEIQKTLDNLTEIDNYDVSSLTEEMILDFYKPSVTVIRSEDTRVYSFIFYENSNIVKMKVDSRLNDTVSSKLLGDALEINYKISDSDKECIKKIFE